MGDHAAFSIDPVDGETPRASTRRTSALDADYTSPEYQPQLQDLELSDTARSQAASRPSSPTHQPQPIKDAVNTAFDQAPTTDQLDPEFLKRLTEHVTDQVIRNLQAANISGPTPPLPFDFPQSPPVAFSPKPVNWSPSEVSPLQSPIPSFPPRFTPPSPRQERFERDVSPGRVFSDAGSSYSGESRESQRSFTSAPFPTETTAGTSDPDIILDLGRRSQTTATDGSVPSTRRSSLRRGQSGQQGPDIRKDSKDVESSHRRPPSIQEDSNEATTVEKIWQPLFDNGNPTARLGQFLRGLAKHIIEDYEPKASLVITPQKMLRFLDETKAVEEHYPWATIFGGTLSCSSISNMYRKLLSEHHLVQQRPHEAPTMPGLTPSGFQDFMTCLIQAHPDTEFDRLSKALTDMPISNADDHRERFPKELSRRLLPARPNVPAEQRIISSLAHEPVLVPLERGALAMPPPPTSAPPQQRAFSGRERLPDPQDTQSSTAVDDCDWNLPGKPLERERKPYYAKEGTGKKYDTADNRDYDRDRDRDWDRDAERNDSFLARDPSRPAANKYRPERPDYPTSRSSRHNSGVATLATYNRGGTTDPMSTPAPNRRTSSGAPPSGPPLNNSSYSKGSRRSPPPNRTFVRNEPIDPGGYPQSQYTSNLPPGQLRERIHPDVDEDSSRFGIRRPNDKPMNYSSDDDLNDRPIPQRNVPVAQSGYVSGYNVAGSSSGDNLCWRGGSEDRRRSWYPGMGPGGKPGGTDGYGSGFHGSSAQH